MEMEKAFALADNLVKSRTGITLNNVQMAIFKAAWTREGYRQVAQQYKLSEDRIKQLARQMWGLLTQALGEKVTKNNFRVLLERKEQLDIDPNHSSSYSNGKYSLESERLNIDLEQKREASITDVVLALPKLSEEVVKHSRFPQGRVALGSDFYIERMGIESECYRQIKETGALLRIKSPQKMGKTSLIDRILQQAATNGYRTVYLDLELADSYCFSELELFMQWFCVSVTEELQLEEQLSQYWKKIYGVKKRCHNYFENYLLPQLEQPLVLALDRVDYIFPHPVAKDFFSLLRAWHEQANRGEANSVWNKLRLVISYSTEAYLIPDINQSPFNVGVAFELAEFQQEQVLQLARQHQLNWSDEEVKQLMKLIGGHPYLVQLALYQIVERKMELEELLLLAHSESGPYSSYLRPYLLGLQEQPQLVGAMKILLEETAPVRLKSEAMFKLQSMGLVKFTRDDRVTFRCELYRQYFGSRLELNSARVF